MKNIIQIGCSDGNDHVFERLSTEPFDSALLVDASEKALKVAREQYKSIDNVSFLQAAVITGDAKEISFFEIDDDEIHGCYSVFRQHIIEHQKKYLQGDRVLNQILDNMLCASIKEIVVPAINMDQLIKDSGFEEIDTLYIDAEGVDCLLIWDMDLDLVPIQTIIFEFVHSVGVNSGKSPLSEACRDKLTEHGYKLSIDPNDEWNMIASK